MRVEIGAEKGEFIVEQLSNIGVVWLGLDVVEDNEVPALVIETVKEVG